MTEGEIINVDDFLSKCPDCGRKRKDNEYSYVGGRLVDVNYHGYCPVCNVYWQIGKRKRE